MTPTPTSSELDRMATELLADDLRSELCRECDRRGVKLGVPVSMVILDREDADTGVRARAARYVCEAGHVWHAGEGKARGRGGDDPILLEEHYAHRRSKETYTESGQIDEFIRPGIFHRDHVER
jgi:hypothetical protein